MPGVGGDPSGDFSSDVTTPISQQCPFILSREDTWNPGFVAEDDRVLLQYSGKSCHCSHGSRDMEGKAVMSADSY